jgi:hypothetical protein
VRRGGKAQGRVSPTRSKAESERNEVCTSEVRKIGETLAPRQSEALSMFGSLFVRMSALIFRVALRQEQAAVVGGERHVSGNRQGGVKLLLKGEALPSSIVRLD